MSLHNIPLQVLFESPGSLKTASQIGMKRSDPVGKKIRNLHGMEKELRQKRREMVPSAFKKTYADASQRRSRQEYDDTSTRLKNIQTAKDIAVKRTPLAPRESIEEFAEQDLNEGPTG